MAVSVAELIESTRITSSLRNNQLFSDTQIASILTDAYADLRDRLIVRFAAWFKSTYDFTLVGGDGGNALDLSLIPDFQMAQGLDLLNGTAPPWSVPMLDSFAERNNGNNLWPFGVGPSFNGFLGRRYWIDGDSLTVYPAPNSNGSYRLIYTPMLEPFALPVLERTFAVNGGDQPGTAGPGPSNAWLLGAGRFVSADVGRTLIPAFAAPNTAWNIPYEVTAFFSSTAVAVTPDPNAIGVFDQPPSGLWSVYEQPAGTIGALPQPLTPWAKYLVLYASLVIRASRRQPAADLELQYQQMQQRVMAATKQRSEGIRQAPLTRGWGNGSGGGWR